MSFWDGKRVAITGGGSGIGKALGRALAAAGARVSLSDVNGDAASAAAREIGGDTEGVALDVTDAQAVAAHIDGIVEARGGIDVVFNNAGIGVGGDLRELNLSHFDRSLDVNVRGVVHGIVAAFPHMKAQGSGILVNTASAAGLLPIPLMAPYAMSKHAVVGLGNSLRFEAAEHGIQITTLCPTAIETPLLETEVSRELGASWRPDLRTYLTRIGGPPYPVDRFVAYALREIERGRAVIVAPRGARFRLGVARIFPSLVERLTRTAYHEMLQTRPND